MVRPVVPRFPSSGRLAVLAVVLAVTVATAVAVLAGVVGPALAHGNHATATPQVSADGTLQVEQAFLGEDGYLVVHRDDGGQPGAVVGHRPLDGGLYRDLRIRIDPAAWANVSGNTTVWVTVHGSDGDGTFEPDDPGADPLLTWFGEPAGDRVTVRKGADATAVVAGPGGPLDDGAVPVDRVVLGQRGHVVVHAAGSSGDSDPDSLGAVVGHRTLEAGNYTDVRVPVAVETPARNESRRLRVVVYAGDGDGQFDDGDRPVRVGGEPVGSTFSLRSTRATPTVAIRTPSPTGPTETAPQAGDGSATEGPGTGGQPGSGTTSTADGPGLGVLAATLAFALVVVGLVRRANQNGLFSQGHSRRQ